MNKKIEILNQLVLVNIGTYYEINLTENIVPGIMYQVIDKQIYNINEMTGLPENARFSDIIEYWSDCLSEEDRAPYFEFFDCERLMRCYENGEEHVFHSYWTKNVLGQPMMAEQHVVMYRDGETGDIWAVTYLLDLAEKYKAEAANKANEAKTEFVSRVAHDIRTPMNSLFGFLQIAEANIHDTDKLEYCLKKIRVAGEFLKELVNDVLDISKMENGKLTLNKTEISITELFEELPTSMQGSDFGKKIDFNCNVHDILCDRLMGDSLRLKQIYTNILANAVKYTPDGGKVDFEVYEQETDREGVYSVVVTVSDTGIGMSDEFMEKMFSKFERATDTRLNKVSGYGLGLTIVKQLVDMMNGTIDVQSSLGNGTTFTVKIELERAADASENAKATSGANAKCRGMKLLVAEDNELSREVIKELLDMNGILCDTAKDGEECVEKFKCANGADYDAILLDIQMPNVNGIDAAKRIRGLNFERAQTIPIIAMTANALSSDVEKSIEAGMNEHLTKPVDMGELLKVLSRLA